MMRDPLHTSPGNFVDWQKTGSAEYRGVDKKSFAGINGIAIRIHCG